MKTCIECLLNLPLDDFHNKFGTKAGKHPRCKICRNRLENERAKAKRGEKSIYTAMAVTQEQIDAKREEMLLATWDQIE